MVAGMGILQTIRHWRSIEVFDTITSIGERFGFDKAATWAILQFAGPAVMGIGGGLAQGFFVGSTLALCVYVMLWVAQREQARAASPPDRSAAQPLISVAGVGQVTPPP